MPKIYFTVINDLSYDQRMHRICGSLANAGFEVVLVGRKLPQSKPLPTGFPFEMKRLKCLFHKGFLFYAEYNLRLFAFLLFRQFDGVCSIDLDTMLAGFGVAKIRQKPHIYDAHEYFTEVPEVIERPRVKAVWEAIANWTIPRTRHAYTVCESLAQVFETRYGTAFQVIRNVPLEVDLIPQSLPPTPSDAPKILLYQGALNDGRGIEEVLQAMPHLEGVVLWLVGEGDLSQPLRHLAKALKVEDKVKFWGYLSPKDLKTITQQADIGLNLLQNKGLNYYYSLANKCFDYIHAEKPALHPNFPEYQKINQQFEIGILLDDLKVETIVQSVQTLTANSLIYNKLAINCRAAKAVFVWEKEEKKLIAFYRNIWTTGGLVQPI